MCRHRSRLEAHEAERSGFSGVIRVDVGGQLIYESAHGFADRAHHVPNTCETRFAVASGLKGYTAAVTMALVERGQLSLTTTARSLLGSDLPLIDDHVTIEHLLSHRSGIGDYLDESQVDSVTDYVMCLPPHLVDSPSATIALLDNRPMTDRPGTRFKYNNGGYALLALLTERATGTSFYDLLDRLVCQPARQQSTGVLRTDALPGDTAIGYLHRDGLQVNTLHVPVRGIGDGGLYTTTDDMARFWQALFAGDIVRPATRHADDHAARPHRRRHALRPRILARPQHRLCRPRRLRRGHLVQERAPTIPTTHLDDHQQLVRRSLAPRRPRRSPPRHQHTRCPERGHGAVVPTTGAHMVSALNR